MKKEEKFLIIKRNLKDIVSHKKRTHFKTPTTTSKNIRKDTFMARHDKRQSNQLRPIIIKKNFTRYAEGSVLISQGHTKVICTASIDEKVPPFLRETGKGWVSAEYSMLPRSTHDRMSRESVKGKVKGRTQEISRLIGRALRSVVDFELLGERQVLVDCDVIQADGGTRCASITGGYVALALAIKKLLKSKEILKSPLTGQVAAISTGILNGEALLDLNYEEDSTAEVDMNFVMTGKGEFVEIQGTAEHHPFTDKQMDAMKSLAKKGIRSLVQIQKKTLS